MNERVGGRGVFYMPFVPGHIERIDIDQPDLLAAAGYVDAAAMIAQQAAAGQAATCFLGSRPIACIGAVDLWPGVAAAWMVAGATARRHPMRMTRAGLAFVDIAQMSMRLYRLQITVRTLDVKAAKWARALGFETEGLMRRYNPDGSDSFLMAIVL